MRKDSVFYDALRLLRKKLPPRLPVKVRTLKGVAADWCFVEGGCFVILLRQRDEQWMVDRLMHEWAHALSWDQCSEREWHSRAWGIAYARVYRALDELRN